MVHDSLARGSTVITVDNDEGRSERRPSLVGSALRTTPSRFLWCHSTQPTFDTVYNSSLASLTEVNTKRNTIGVVSLVSAQEVCHALGNTILRRNKYGR
jgi:hypothetical protein